MMVKIHCDVLSTKGRFELWPCYFHNVQIYITAYCTYFFYKCKFVPAQNVIMYSFYIKHFLNIRVRCRPIEYLILFHCIARIKQQICLNFSSTGRMTSCNKNIVRKVWIIWDNKFFVVNLGHALSLYYVANMLQTSFQTDLQISCMFTCKQEYKWFFG